jgi:hypothetical protein
MTLIIVAFSKIAFSLMTLSMMALSKTTFSLMIKHNNIQLNETQHNDIQ